jgi:hypothetical protein
MRRFTNALKRFIKQRILLEGKKPSYMVSEKSLHLLRGEASTIASEFFSNMQGSDVEHDMSNIVSDFFLLYSQRPIKKNMYGSGFENLFWLYVTGRLLQPDLIVESGIWGGQTTWILRVACPEAELHSFDIDLANRQYINDSVHYHECDWSTVDLGEMSNRKTLCFFDDHVNQSKRILEAHEKGFKNLIFDDNLPVYMLFRETSTITPTVDMVYDDALKDGDVIEWVKSGVYYSCVVDAGLNAATRAKVLAYANFPLVDYTAETAATKARFGGNSKTAFVRLH